MSLNVTANEKAENTTQKLFVTHLRAESLALNTNWSWLLSEGTHTTGQRPFQTRSASSCNVKSQKVRMFYKIEIKTECNHM